MNELADKLGLKPTILLKSSFPLVLDLCTGNTEIEAVLPWAIMLCYNMIIYLW